MKLIKTILESKPLVDQPPVLVDIGASGEIHARWKQIAPYSICVAFDADGRDFSVQTTEAAGYRKLYKLNRIVVSDERPSADFFLTQSPHCSSLLLPTSDKLKSWFSQSYFKVEKKVELPAISLAKVLGDLKLEYVDWLKTDSQGTDLRLFLSVPEPIRRKILAADFEPGIIDAYSGEDKLSQILEALPKHGFWFCTMEVRGFPRITPDRLNEVGPGYSSRIIRNSPCWAEVTCLREQPPQSERDLLLLAVFALVENQPGFALEVLDFARTLHSDPIFESSRQEILKHLRPSKLTIPLIRAKSKMMRLMADIPS